MIKKKDLMPIGYLIEYNIVGLVSFCGQIIFLVMEGPEALMLVYCVGVASFCIGLLVLILPFYALYCDYQWLRYLYEKRFCNEN